MKPRYLCIDPAWSGGTPPDVLLTRTIYTGARWAVKPDQWPYVGHCLELGLNVALVIDSDSGDPAQYFDWATSDWMLSRVKWFVGNEPDGSGPASWTMTPDQYGVLWQSATGLHGERWIAGMVSGDTTRARQYLQPDAAGLGVHLYTLSPSQAAQRVNQYQQLHLPVWVGETHAAAGYKLGDYTWQVPVNDFCYAEAQVPGLGLWA